MKESNTVAYFLCILLATVVASSELQAQPQGILGTPKAIQDISSAIHGKGPKEVRALLIDRLGRPHRDIGSGLKILQWDMSNGVLTFHPDAGPSFQDAKKSRTIWLIPTTNLVSENLFQSYEMTTLPDKANNGARYWLGNLRIDEKMSYQFDDSGLFRDRRGLQEANFFVRCPTGVVNVTFRGRISSQSHLETVPEGSTIADLVFSCAAAKGGSSFAIVSSEQTRRLIFVGKSPLSFQMETSWKRFW